MMNIITNKMEFIIWIIAAYGMSQIVVFGSIFNKPRKWITKHSTFFGDLLECMMCTSTWVGLITIPYTNIFFDGMVASGGVWTINAIVEWHEENRPKKKDEI